MERPVARTLAEWLDHQAGQHPHAIDLGLGRLNEVLARLAWHRPSVPVITVAGTNGKGSVVATCAAILAAAGLRVGAFTSPHLRDYRERIRIEDRLVDENSLIGAFERIEAARGAVGLTFFEYNTLAALLILEHARLDAWILEVGMGGRLDAVNVVDADVAVVVSIGFDHMQFLGQSLESIGREKAGIFRGGQTAVLGSRRMPGVVAATALRVGAALRRLGTEFDYTRAAEGAWAYRGPRWDLDSLPPPALRGATQYDNAATAIAAVEALELRTPVSAAAVAEGLRSVRLVGRFQTIEPKSPNQPQWVLDVAHNPDAAHVLALNLRAWAASGRTLAICGILADKDAAGIVAALRGAVDAWLFVTTQGDRGASGRALAARVAAQVAAPLSIYDSIDTACAAALAGAGAGDRIVVCGSFHTVGPALDWLEAQGI